MPFALITGAARGIGGETAQFAAGGEDAVAGDEDGDGVGAAGLAHGAGGKRAAQALRQFAVAAGAAAREGLAVSGRWGYG